MQKCTSAENWKYRKTKPCVGQVCKQNLSTNVSRLLGLPTSYRAKLNEASVQWSRCLLAYFEKCQSQKSIWWTPIPAQTIWTRAALILKIQNYSNSSLTDNQFSPDNGFGLCEKIVDKPLFVAFLQYLCHKLSHAAPTDTTECCWVRAKRKSPRIGVEASHCTCMRCFTMCKSIFKYSTKLQLRNFQVCSGSSSSKANCQEEEKNLKFLVKWSNNQGSFGKAIQNIQSIKWRSFGFELLPTWVSSWDHSSWWKSSRGCVSRL